MCADWPDSPPKPLSLWWAIESIGLFLLLSLPQYRDQFLKGNPFYDKNLKYGPLRWFRGSMVPAAKPEDPVRSGTHVVKGESQLPLSSDLYKHSMAHVLNTHALKCVALAWQVRK